MNDDKRDEGPRNEMEELTRQLASLNAQPVLRTYSSVSKMLALQFARGLAFGLGTVVGATILVSFLALLLSKIDFIPIIGEWAAEVVRMIEEQR